MKGKFISILFGSFLTIMLSVSVVCGYFTFTGAWLTDKHNVDVELSLGNAVSVVFSKSQFDMDIGERDGVTPGERFNMERITIGSPENTSTCYVRIKLDLVGTYSSNFVLDSSTAGQENTITVAGNGAYVWKKIGTYYYLIANEILDVNATIDDITLIAVEANHAYNMQIQGILALSSLGNANGGQEANIQVTAQAIQAANYTSANWAVFDA